MARTSRSSLLAATAVLTAGVVLAACTPPGEVDSDKKIDTAVEGKVVTAPSSADAMAPASTDAEEPAAENVKVSASATQLAQGDALTVELTGLNPKVGYYTAICAAGTAEGEVPACTGTLTDPATAAWITNSGRGTTTMSAEGAATVNITATAKGDNVDCTTNECVIKVFGDHSEGFRNVAELPVTFTS
ncbi:neocarzinostatin apoprotein domain-containing protein [Corynebacterium felinum]|uniref:Thiamine biosynthesis protein n=1 Tax=Corynebacterium felinum TaxID=131318 RepID=A0ABU2BCC9_9CORY|nr:neocarzinostatin apoprotein domain-containing protein [Corynebacterium felinum]MDF5821191.1 neocarzinostatin apoprotein domain-containing protein [Corynebacterium felinum]MDR7356292.1 hypothetical protein [Corynebacterium felinum]WJY95625.1 hypothetical protein CFELI_10135 [Corynebacterium felinum]